MNFRRGDLDITPGFGFITQVEGVPGPSAQLAYTCTYVMPEGIYEGIEHQIPCAGRWPDPLEVIPHPLNVPFPAYRVNRTLQPYMLPEIPAFDPCPGNRLAARALPSGSLAAAFMLCSEVEKRAIAEQLKRYL